MKKNGDITEISANTTHCMQIDTVYNVKTYALLVYTLQHILYTTTTKFSE